VETVSDNSIDRLGIMLFIAVALHAVIILGITFDFTERAKQPPAERTLDIIVVPPDNASKSEEKARFLAQSNRQAGGETDKLKRPSTRAARPHPPSRPAPTPERTPSRQRASIPQAPQKQVLSTTRSPQKVLRERKRQPDEKRKRQPDIQQLLASTNQEIDRLTAEIEQTNRALSQKSRRKHISAATKEYIYANYLDAWRRKVERIGNLNYPEEAKRKKLAGELVLHVAVRADGTIERVRILRSSGKKVLDDAAIRIVKLAAPFAPFPQEIRKNVDILDITRTWQFGEDDHLFTGNH